jgi:hypothetical protein
MKSTVLDSADRASAQAMLVCLMDMNNRDDANANQVGGAYGFLHDAICQFVFQQTGIYINHVDWNLGDNRMFVDDIQQAINESVTLSENKK